MVSQPLYQPQRHDRLTAHQSISLLYHDIWNFPLKEKELAKWHPGEKLKLVTARPRVVSVSNYFVLYKKEDAITKREENEASSREKMKMLSIFRRIFDEDENIVFVGITGSMAMNSASPESDIDLMIITKAGTLWQTRLSILLKLRKIKAQVRKAGEKNESDKLCINIWMDERDLKIENKNPYTAHELAQIVPLINKGGAYDRLLSENSWISDYWPRAVEIKEVIKKHTESKFSLKEWGAYNLQKLYMKRKMTREVVTKTRAFFHPMDWNVKVKKELSKRGVEYV